MTAAQRQTRYRRNGHKAANSDKRYLARPFVAWDGEGVNNSDGSHAYVLLANSLGDRLVSPPPSGISTHDALTFLLDGAEKAPRDAIHVIYGGSYDINMMLGDLTAPELWALRKFRTVKLRGFRLQWRAGKSLTVKQDGRSIILYDVVSFFQTSFVNACDQYLGSDWLDRDIIIREKAKRGTFVFKELREIQSYNDSELTNLLALMEELRARLYRAGIRIPRWDGPGAVATSLLRTYGVKAHMASVPESVGSAARFAYAGGRFELVKFGHTNQRAYQYDVNSAYPTALVKVPCLAHGAWLDGNTVNPDDHPFSLYHIEWDYRETDQRIPKPFFIRYRQGTVAYPAQGSGWYWQPEIMAARDTGWSFTVLESYSFVPTCKHEPFGWIPGLYQRRRALKEAGDGAHIGIKLGLNSLYGKTAQQVGWQPGRKPGDPPRIPPYHQLEWAGYVTSHCRSQVYRAAMQAPYDVIGFETDAVFSLRPLSLPLGGALGEWEETTYADITYVQSGMYFATKLDGSAVAKSRGVDKGQLTRDRVLLAGIADGKDAYLDCKLTRFVTAGVALMQDFARWRRWETQTKRIHLAPSGKTAHVTCEDDCPHPSGLHYAECWIMTNFHSAEFPIEWINPDPGMVVNEEGVDLQTAREWRDLVEEPD